MESFVQGLAVGAGLIVAIGAQNSFILTQGIRKQYRAIVAIVCSFADISLIFAGAAGIGAAVANNISFQNTAAWCGAVFLFWYGARSLISAFKGGYMEGDNENFKSCKAVITTTLALTFLNPHVYLDTIVLIGGISGQYDDNGRYLFALGASTASCVWFFMLAFGASYLAPLFRRPVAWRVLDSFMCLVMWVIAFRLIPIDFKLFQYIAS